MIMSSVEVRRQISTMVRSAAACYYSTVQGPWSRGMDSEEFGSGFLSRCERRKETKNFVSRDHGLCRSCSTTIVSLAQGDRTHDALDLLW